MSMLKPVYSDVCAHAYTSEMLDARRPQSQLAPMHTSNMYPMLNLKAVLQRASGLEFEPGIQGT